MSTNVPLDSLYETITGENRDERTCEAIPASACTEVPRNFFLNGLNGTATKLAEQIASPELVLAWLLSTLGAPPLLAGLLVPVRRAGALLPQLAVAGWIRGLARRKWMWTAAGATQALALVLMALAVAYLPPAAAGGAVVALLAVFSVASGMGSVAFQDVMGKTIPKGRRGTLLAFRATSGGLLALLAGWWLKTHVRAGNDLSPYVLLLLAAALLWLLAALLFAAIAEEPGATSGGRNPLAVARESKALLRTHRAFRRFLAARCLLLSAELAVPFYALLAKNTMGSDGAALGVLVMATSLASVISSPGWGRFADRSSKSVMALSGALAAAAGALALGLTYLPGEAHSPYAFAAVFVVIGFAVAGERLGRKTYLVDAVEAERRPLYVALGNTVVGSATLLAGALGLVAQAFGSGALIALLSAMAVAGALVSRTLPAPEDFPSAPAA